MQTIDAYQRGGIIQTDTASLLSRVLWITTAGFLLTAFGAYIAPDSMGVSYLVLVLVNFGMIFAISRTSRTSPGLALGLFYLYTVLMGVQISPILNQYTHSAAGRDIVFNAALTTALGMGVMGLAAQFARFDYTKLASVAYAALLALVIVGVVGLFIHIISPGAYAWLTLVVFSVLLFVDFMRLKDGGRGATPVMLALSIYLDALNIFIALLQIFGGGSRRRD
jgi:modulator of FtsH protease